MSSVEFKDLLNSSNICKTPSFLIRYKKASTLKIGFSINRKFGSAVNRNICKRKVRALVRSVCVDNWCCHVAFQLRVVLEPNINYSNEIALFVRAFKQGKNNSE